MSSSEHQAEGAALASIELHLIGTHGVVHFKVVQGHSLNAMTSPPSRPKICA